MSVISKLTSWFNNYFVKPTLSQETAAPNVLGLHTVWSESLGKITPARLDMILREAEQGNIAEYLLLAQEMEEQDLHYASVLSTLKQSVLGLKISVSAASDSEHDVMLADLVRTHILNKPTFKPLLLNILDALGKGFSVNEIIWDTSTFHKIAQDGENAISRSLWTPKKYLYRFPNWFQFDRQNGTEVRLTDGSIDGKTLPPSKFIIHFPILKSGIPIRGGLARAAAHSFLRKKYIIKNWMMYAETCYMPIRLGKYDIRANANDINILTKAVRDIGADAAAVIPDSMAIDFIQPTNVSAGAENFLKQIDFENKEQSKLVLGQTMTTDSGSSRAQAQVHDAVRMDRLASIAEQVADTINRDLITPFIDLNFGVQEQYPMLHIAIPEKQDIAALADALQKLVPLGLTVETSVIRDILGLPDPAEGADLIKAAPAPPPAKPQLNSQQPVTWENLSNPLLTPLINAISGAGDYGELDYAEILKKMDVAQIHEDLTAQTFISAFNESLNTHLNLDP